LSVLPLFRTSYPHANRRVGQHLPGEEPWVFPSPLSRPSVKQPLSRRDSHSRVHRLHDSKQAKWGFCQGHYQEPPEGTPKAYLIPVVQILQGYLTDCACKSTQKYRARQGFALFLTFFNNYSLRFLLRLLSCCLFSSSWLRRLIRLYSSAFLSRSFMNFSIEGISPA